MEQVTDEQAIAFQIISSVGMAKSTVMEALFAAKKGDFQEAEHKLKEAKEYFVDGHHAHASLIQKEAQGDEVKLSLIFMHAEDQLMTTETISLLVKEMIYMHKLIQEK
jgi:PTS system cellobiose-specific IIA component